MVTAGFPATVAPLGTALTEDQLALLWKMADEPVLCFDGDNAGLRAAYRAVDLAMPRLKPGKSLQFALLPRGPGPRRSGALRRPRGGGGGDRRARGRSPTCCGRARPKAASFDTPERRAALEARINEVTAGIGDEAVRKYYRQDFDARLRQFFAPAQTRARQFPARAGRGQDWRERGRRQWQPRSGAPQRPAARPARTRPMWWSASSSPPARCMRGHRTAVPHARGADPAGGAQSSLAAARPSGGIRRARVPPCRRRAAAKAR